MPRILPAALFILAIIYFKPGEFVYRAIAAAFGSARARGGSLGPASRGASRQENEHLPERLHVLKEVM